MAATPGEFVSALATAFPAAATAGDGWAEVAEDGVRLRFDYAVGPPRRIGSLELPSLLVTISVLEGDPDPAAELLARVDRATQRGGG